MAQVVCVCTECKVLTFVDTGGNICRGQLVGPATRLRHDRRDSEIPQLPTATVPAPVPQVPRPAPVPVSPLDFTGHLDSIVLMCSTFLLWLRLSPGVSRVTYRKVAGSLRLITAAVTYLVTLVFLAYAIPQTAPRIDIALDERTLLQRLDLEPTIIRSVCCPRCFTAYSIDAIPATCTRRESARARVCGEVLTRIRQTRSGPKTVPRMLYSTQSFESWLRFFLSRGTIEKALEIPFAPRRDDGKMHGIWDSPAWRSLPGAFTSIKHNLVFSFYLDWFNPFGNKKGGKIVSCGAVMLACMNLPPEIRYLPENLFFCGVMPPPFSADVITLSHLIAPIIAQLAALFVGMLCSTFEHPDGVWVRVAILPIIADLGAIRKLCGYVSHSADYFCSYCLQLYSDIDSLELGTPRAADEVRSMAQRWRAATTIKARKEITDEAGIRWSPLHDLPYWDPVRSLVPGFMHNWCEGVLTRHLRVFWGIGIPDDVAEAEKAATALEQDASALASLDGDDEMDDDFALDADFIMDDNSTIHADSDYIDVDPLGPAVLLESEIAAIRHCCQHIILPTWVERPPINLGEKIHGKLKAETVLTLFTVVLPLVLPEIWTKAGAPDRHRVLLRNFAHLVAATNIIASYSTSDSLADSYLEHLMEYRRSRTLLWPDLHAVPNDHIALHNADALKFWGPLPPLSEFAFERQNGVLAGISTNNHLYDMDLTMLRQICRRGRLEARIRDGSDNPEVQTLYSLLVPDAPSSVPKVLTPEEEVTQHKYDSPLSESDYDLIFNYLHSRDVTWRRYDALPHPPHPRIVPLRARSIKTTEIAGRTYGTHDAHIGNSSVRFYMPENPTETSSGFIKAMWTMAIGGALRTFLAVHTHIAVAAPNAPLSPYLDLPDMGATVVATHSSFSRLILEPHHVISHVPLYPRPNGTFDMLEDVYVISSGLNRGRR
ncbi:hypothetical protein EXIGLDRAFT_666338 [Exidia glandulosa HHB12029]|uniref:Uncharacterized protein n=1 Tax=Exidia glandulosa HHB12029 TaxID=1314781 RepID=A0A165NWN9_EXIGL|nr:hypothetical protein EXIGLDRAFT_666338 [Exidia glandulosa HHB12029]